MKQQLQWQNRKCRAKLKFEFEEGFLEPIFSGPADSISPVRIPEATAFLVQARDQLPCGFLMNAATEAQHFW
jgi:hypothetical protein